MERETPLDKNDRAIFVRARIRLRIPGWNRRHRVSLNKHYVALLDRHIADAKRLHEPDSLPLQASNVQGSLWSIGEKECLFRALGRHGKSNLAAIFDEFGTKSHMEILIYLSALDVAYNSELQQDLTRHKKKKRLVNIAQFPIAFEMTDDWIAIEEMEAERLIKWEEARTCSIHATRNEWPLLSSPLTMNLAPDLTDCVEAGLPDIALFDTHQMLQLSEKLYNLVDPSLHRNTLLLLYDIVRQVCTRLIWSSLFLARSRLSAEIAHVFTRMAAHDRIRFVRLQKTYVANLIASMTYVLRQISKA